MSDETIAETAERSEIGASQQEVDRDGAVIVNGAAVVMTRDAYAASIGYSPDGKPFSVTARFDQGEVRPKDPIDQAYDEWKEADASALALQRVVSETWARYDEGFGAPPPREQLLELAGRRRAAADKLAQAIDLLHEAGRIQPARSTRVRTAARP